MQQNFDDITYYVGSNYTIEQMQSVSALTPFSEDVIEFLNSLSQTLMKSGKKYSDVATFGFWCRRASIENYKNKYSNFSNRLGKGIAFHIAPSNVPVNFAYSLVVGLMAGNANIVRLPTRDFEQTTIICDAINELIKVKFKYLSPYINLVKYPRGSIATDLFSSICNVRIIWGGDKTIEDIRRSPLKPRASEVTFADRYSICLIDSDNYLEISDKIKIAQEFYNDTYFSDQNACTSTRLVVWKGNSVEVAKNKFWSEINKLAKEKYQLQPIQAVGKLSAFCRFAAANNNVHVIDKNNCYVMRIELEELNSKIMEFKYNSGFFFEYTIENLTQILPVCNERCQTLSYLGIDKNEIIDFINTYKPKGIDRVVPMGKTMDFSLEWDGYDLIYSLSRIISNV